MKKTLFITLSPLILLCHNLQALEISKHLATIAEPTPKLRVNPEYPIDAARNNREGWATFSFIIEKDGSVSNVITKETSGSEDITLAAKKAIMQWQYQPALENGEPIQQCANSVKLNFRMNKKNGASGVTRRFRHLYGKTQAALAEKDYEQVKELLGKFSKLKAMHLSENNYLQLISAQYASEIGDPALQLSHLNKAAFNFDRDDSEQIISILKQKLILEVKLNHLKSAYATFARLQYVAADEPYLADYQAMIEYVNAYINSDKDLVIHADIRSEQYWHYALIRNEFTLTNITGKLTKMDIRCANKRHLYSIESDNTWKIPDTWQQCNLYIYGDNNSTFNLVEHPFKA